MINLTIYVSIIMGPGVNNKLTKKKRTNRLNLVFDESKRREFLTGFHKRKLQRKKKAKDELEQQLKDERKRLKAAAKESYKKMVVSRRPVPEIEHLLDHKYEDENVTVRVVELSVNDIAKENNMIGVNQPIYEESEPEESETEDNSNSEIQGMELKQMPTSSKTEDAPVFSEEKDLKRALKKQATKNVKNSKIFQMKNKIESRKQKRKSRQLRTERRKVFEKKNKHKNIGNSARNR